MVIIVPILVFTLPVLRLPAWVTMVFFNEIHAILTWRVAMTVKIPVAAVPLCFCPINHRHLRLCDDGVVGGDAMGWS